MFVMWALPNLSSNNISLWLFIALKWTLVNPKTPIIYLSCFCLFVIVSAFLTFLFLFLCLLAFQINTFWKPKQWTNHLCISTLFSSFHLLYIHSVLDSRLLHYQVNFEPINSHDTTISSINLLTLFLTQFGRLRYASSREITLNFGADKDSGILVSPPLSKNTK